MRIIEEGKTTYGTEFKIVLKKKYGADSQFDYILEINTGRTEIEIESFLFDFIVMGPAIVRNVRVPVRELWQMVDACHGRAPIKAFRTDGSTFWTEGRYDRTTGKCVRITAGNASPFDVIERKL